MNVMLKKLGLIFKTLPSRTNQLVLLTTMILMTAINITFKSKCLIGLAPDILAVLSLPVLGSYSDHVGRKVPIIISTVGLVIER